MEEAHAGGGPTPHERSWASADRGFVGREAELRSLQAAAAAATRGRGSSWLIEGEPGMGKTRLAGEVAWSAQSAGLAVRWGRCWEDGGAPPYWPWTQVITAGASADDLRRLRQELGEQVAPLGAVVPDMRATADDETPKPDGDAARLLLFNSVWQVLHLLAQRRPLLVIIDDLHAADLGSLQLLEYVAVQLADAPLMLLACNRDPELRLRGDATPILDRYRRVSTELTLKGLTEQQLGELAGALGRGAAEVSHPQLHEIHQQTEGVPLFAAEALMAMAQGAGTGSVAGGSARTRYESFIRGRVDALLGEDVTEVLRTAAVLGRDFELPVLARVSQRGRGELVSLLAAAVHARVLDTDPESPFHYAFGHELVRDALYGALPAAERMRLHGDAARALEAQHGPSVERYAGVVAHHLFLAGPLTDVERAVDYHLRAAEQAQELSSYDQAIRYHRRALEVLRNADDPASRRQGELLIRLGNVQNRAGDAEAARRSFLEAAELARSLPAPDLLADAAVGYGRETITSGASDAVLVRLLEEALTALADDDDRRWIDVATRLAIELYYTAGEEAEARRVELADEAVRRARKLDDPQMLSYAIEASTLATAGPDNVEARLAAGAEIIELADRSNRREGRQSGHVWRAAALLELADIPAFEEELQRYAEIADELRQPAHLWYVAMLRATHALLTGPLPQAADCIEAALAVGEQARSEEATEYHLMQRWTHAWLSEDTEAFTALEPALHDLARRHTSLPASAAALSCTYRRLDRPAEARREVDAVVGRDLAVLPRNLGWLALLALLAEAVTAEPDPDLARTLYDLLQPYEGRCVVLDWSMAPLGASSYYLGLLASMLGEHDAAIRHLQRAAQEHERMGAIPWLVRTLRTHATVVADREPRAAAALRARAAAAADGQGGVTRRGPPAPQTSSGTFRKEGDYWTIGLGEEAVRVRKSRGLDYLAVLLAQPGREFHALDLVAVIQRTTRGTRRDASAISADLATDRGVGDAGELLDPLAKAAYRRRLRELQDDIDEATANYDPERATRAKEEMDFLVRQLAGAVGLGGRDRKGASAAERARVSVTKSIHAALHRLREEAPDLGGHLGNTVRTGYYCSYNPDPRAPITWRT